MDAKGDIFTPQSLRIVHGGIMAKKPVVQINDILIPSGIDQSMYPCLPQILSGFVANKIMRLTMYNYDRKSDKMLPHFVRARPANIYMGFEWAEDPTTGKRSMDPTHAVLTMTAYLSYAKGFDRKTGADIWNEEGDGFSRVNLMMVTEAPELPGEARPAVQLPPGKVLAWPDCAFVARTKDGLPHVVDTVIYKRMLEGHGWIDRCPLYILI
jgi:hypothetical protein